MNLATLLFLTESSVRAKMGYPDSAEDRRADLEALNQLCRHHPELI